MNESKRDLGPASATLCDHCDGEGYVDDRSADDWTRRCPDCDGTGLLPLEERWDEPGDEEVVQ